MNGIRGDVLVPGDPDPITGKPIPFPSSLPPMLSQTPPQSATAGSPVDAQTQKILNMLMNSISQQRFAGQPRPSPVPGLTDPREAQKIGMNTAWPHAWGFERFAAGLQASIGNAIAMHKEAQIQKAEAIYDYYGNLLNNLYAAQSSGDQKAIQEAQQKLDNFYKDKGNIQALHKAAKWLNQRWLEPEKTDSWGTAYSRSLAKQKEKDEARSGIVNLFRHAAGHFLGRRPQPQLTPEESVQAGRQIQERAPTQIASGIEGIQKLYQTEEAIARTKEAEARTKAVARTTIDEDIADAAKSAQAAGVDPSTDPKVQQLLRVKQQGLKIPEKEMLLGVGEVQRVNNALESQWQIVNPGKPLPDQFRLKFSATQAEYDRLDRDFQRMLTTEGTVENRKLAQEQRGFMRSQREEQDDLRKTQATIGVDPSTGKEVLVPFADAKRLQLQYVVKAGEQELRQATSAREWLGSLADKEAEKPEEMGIRQLIDLAEKKKELGPAVGRWNEFMAGRVGAGDPVFIALRNKLRLSQSLLMNVHVGSRGGSFMLEHFQDLAEAGKMTPEALRAGFESETDYVRGRAMLPAGLTMGKGMEKGTVRFIEGTDQYDIPTDKVGAFKKAHPNAKQQ